MKVFRQYFGILIAGLLLFFLIKPLVETHASLKTVTFQVQWQWLIFSFLLILFYWSVYLYPFATLLRGITQKQVPFRSAWTLFHLANITRYLPGRIWGFVRLLSLSKRFGLSKTAVGGSLTLHVGIETVLGGLFGLSLLFSKQMRDTTEGILEKMSGHTVLWGFAIGGVVVGVLFLIPTLSAHTRRVVKTLKEIGHPLFQKPFWKRRWLHIFVSHVLLWMCQGLAFALFVRSLAPVQWADTGVIAACYAFAWIIGFLSFLTPGGLGIREGLLGLLLANYIPIQQATLAALLCRVWGLSAEGVLAGIAFFVQRRSPSTPPVGFR